MPLPTGSQLGPYEVIALLGAAGMGEVIERVHYAAIDEGDADVVLIRRSQ